MHLGKGDGVGVLHAKGDVVQDGLRKQHRLLAHYRHLRAHAQKLLSWARSGKGWEH